MKKTGQIFVLILFTALAAMCGWLVIHYIESLARQSRAESFAETEGKILSATVTTTTGSRGRTYYHPHLLYTYEVSGQSYQGKVYRYDNYPADRNKANQIVASHPAGSAIKVYYDPGNPADAVLSPRVIALDVSRPFLFAPLFFWMMWTWWSVLVQGNRRKGISLAGGVKILSRGLVTRVRLPRYSAVGMGLCTAGGISLIAAIVILMARIESPTRAGFISLWMVIIGGGLVYGWQFRKIASGTQDLVIDEDARIVRLPLTYKRKQQQPIPYSEIKAITLVKISHQTKNKVYYTYAPTLRTQGGTPQRLTDLEKGRAESFAKWLREKLGITATENDPD
jgi:hypothetical protein